MCHRGLHDPTALNYEANATQADDASCYYTLPSVIINEIHYNPCGAQGDDFDYEFVELLNIGDVTVDLSGYEFYNESAGDDQLSLVFPEGTSMAAGEFIVLVVSEAGLAAYGGNGYQVFVLDAGNFSNSGEAISLRDGFGNVVNAVDYNDAAPWPAASLGILGNNYVESPDGGCATLEYIPEILDLFLTTPPPTATTSEATGRRLGSTTAPQAWRTLLRSVQQPRACNFNPNAILGNEASASSTAATVARTSRRTTTTPTRPSTMERANSPWRTMSSGFERRRFRVDGRLARVLGGLRQPLLIPVRLKQHQEGRPRGALLIFRRNDLDQVVFECARWAGVFLFGMRTLSDAIRRASATPFRQFLSSVTQSTWVGTVTGFFVTSLIQSSSAVTVTLVSLVNAGLLTIRESVGVLLGTNVGTTITAWLIVLSLGAFR